LAGYVVGLLLSAAHAHFQWTAGKLGWETATPLDRRMIPAKYGQGAVLPGTLSQAETCRTRPLVQGKTIAMGTEQCHFVTK